MSQPSIIGMDTLVGKKKKQSIVKKENKDFPGGSVIKNPPANEGDTGLIPGLGRSHMPWSNKTCEPQLLSPRAATTEPTCCNY